jgi:pimeloyl-ACP methyl ester carboxylesterase
MKEIPLLLIHGYPFDHSMWFSTIASLGSKAKVIAPDLPGFGKEPVLKGTKPSMEAYADYLVRHLGDYHYEKVAVVGMSMGGYVALALAEKHPSRVACLGLVSSQPAADTLEAKQARKEMIQKIQQRGPSAASEAILPKLFAEEHAANAELRKYAEIGADRAGREGLSWALEAMAARPDRSRFLNSIDYPVLIFHGIDDKIVPIAKARAAAELCQKPIFVEAGHAGHATPLEVPDQVAHGLVRLIRACKESLPPEPNPS